MRVLLVNKFLHHVGGVETYVAWQAQALVAGGHAVAVVGMDAPTPLHDMPLPDVPVWRTPTRRFEAGAPGRARSAASSVWSAATARVMSQALHAFRPDVVHFHGTCYQLTPSVVHVAHRWGSPLVLTAHEYKLVCANQTLFDDSAGRICDACVGANDVEKVMAPLRRGCMKGSRAVTMLGAAEGRLSERTWRRADPLVLAPSMFMRDLLVRDGWSPDRIRYLDLPWRREDQAVGGRSADPSRDSVLFVGRLAAVKGVELLLRVWRVVAGRHPELRLRIVGDGAERGRLERYAADLGVPRVDFLGRCAQREVREHLDRALVTVHPAQWFENSPFAVRESLMAGVPAAVSDLGGMPELVGPSSGWVVPHDDEVAWQAVLETAISARRSGCPDLRAEVSARALTDEDHLASLVSTYESQVIARAVS